MKIPKTIYSIKSNIIFGVGLLVFVMLFAITYTPNYGLSEISTGTYEQSVGGYAITQWYEHQGLCLPVCCAIILAVTAISRTILLLTTHTHRIKESEYLLWQLLEVIVSGLFCSLFLSLYMHMGFFVIMPSAVLIYFSVAIYPYTAYWLLSERIDRDIRIAEAQRTILALRQGAQQEASTTLRFADDKGTVRLIVSVDRVISIESAGNYVTILYENNGKLMRYSLRNSLKNIESLCVQHSLIRCHRSYYINLLRVKLLRKEADSLYAEIDLPGVDDIPISKSYAADVMQRFGER